MKKTIRHKSAGFSHYPRTNDCWSRYGSGGVIVRDCYKILDIAFIEYLRLAGKLSCHNILTEFIKCLTGVYVTDVQVWQITT
jgi:hypothetical protein